MPRKLGQPATPRQSDATAPGQSAPNPSESGAAAEKLAERVEAGRAQVEKQSERFLALVQERPEVGLGVAFFGGLILASILKRFAR